MTIRVMVKNDDSRKDVMVSVQQLDAAGNEIPGIPAKVLHGGESAENYVHSTNQLVVREMSASPSLKFGVEFDFRPGQKVKTHFGDVGIIKNCTVDQDGLQYWVSRSQESQWFRASELTAVDG